MSLGIESMSPADIAACTGNCGNKNSGDDGMWGNGAWWIIILLLFGWGRNGFGGGFGGNGGGYEYSCGAPATQADLAAGFNNSAVLSNLNDLKLGQSSLQNTLCQGFNGVNTSLMSGFAGVDNAICTLGYQTQQGINGISREISDCCCTTQRAIDGVNYNLATQSCETRNTIQNTTRDIIDNQNANSRAIFDKLSQIEYNNLNDKYQAAIAENQSLKSQAMFAQQNQLNDARTEAQTAEIFRRFGFDRVTCPIASYNVPNPNCCYNGCNGSF